MNKPSSGRPRGRPKGRPDTRSRSRIRAAARRGAARPLFLEFGYRATTVRAIAAAAVDPALINYHFGTEQALFAEALALPCADPNSLERALHGDPAALAERLLDAVTDQWDRAHPAELVLAARDETTMAVLRDYLDTHLRPRIAEFLGGLDATQRATAAIGVLGGLIFTRYLSPLPTIANLTRDDVRRTFAPALHTALRPPNSRRASRPAPRTAL